MLGCGQLKVPAVSSRQLEFVEKEFPSLISIQFDPAWKTIRALNERSIRWSFDLASEHPLIPAGKEQR